MKWPWRDLIFVLMMSGIMAGALYISKVMDDEKKQSQQLLPKGDNTTGCSGLVRWRDYENRMPILQRIPRAIHEDITI